MEGSAPKARLSELTPSRASSAPTGLRSRTELRFDPQTVGAELARDSVLPHDTASRPANACSSNSRNAAAAGVGVCDHTAYRYRDGASDTGSVTTPSKPSAIFFGT